MAKSRVACFIANYSKTYFFHELAQRLREQDVEICWIVVNKKLRDFLVGCYGPDAVLYLSKDDANHPREPISDYRVNELVYGDRALRCQDRWAYAFLENIQRPVYEFLQRHRVGFLFGEVTWAHELLIHRLVSDRHELESIYCSPHTVRLPGGRFGLFTDEYQSELLELPPLSRGYEAAAEPVALDKPTYLALNDTRLKQARSLQGRLRRLRCYLTMENIDRADPTLVASRWLSLKHGVAEEINRVTYRLVPNVKFDSDLAERNYVFFGLHKQPEASIDVTGRYYENQWMNIVNVWRALPDGWYLLVKEHSNAIGDRPLGFYRKVRRLRKVVLVDAAVDSHEIIRNAKAVITVSGTVAYEAVLMGVPSFTFANTFFNYLPGCRRIGLDDLRRENLAALIQPIDHQAVARFSSWLHNHSAHGDIGDPLAHPACMTPENVGLVAGTIYGVVGG